MPEIRIGNIRGMSYRHKYWPQVDERQDLAEELTNVLLEHASIGRRRGPLGTTFASAPWSFSGDIVRQLLRHQPTSDPTSVERWIFSGTSTLTRMTDSASSSPTASDTVTAWATSRPYGATFNGKLFLAYDSDVNRLHVWDGSVVRRVGIAASAAATVANTGAGAYAATLRYYKIQWRIVSGSDTVATSELSASVSFTPSGAGTAARITKPTTPDSATHWIVFGSADNVTYYDISGNIAVGTTTYDDSAAPSSYSDGDVAPTAGLYIPPPAAKFLLAADNRLFMAGCWETSASAGQTDPRTSRVWFTQVLGSLDNTGEDEAIAQTTSYKDYVDCGEHDGDAITALSGPLDGIVYVFKRKSVWRLVPTGLSQAPYRPELVTGSLGCNAQDAVTVGETASGAPALYFVSKGGPFRLTAGRGVEYLGHDLFAHEANYIGTTSELGTLLVWYARQRALWVFKSGSTTALAFQPAFEFTDETGRTRGGWTRHTNLYPGANTSHVIYAAAALEQVEASVAAPLIHVGGGSSTTGAVAILADEASDYRDFSNNSFAIPAVFTSACVAMPGAQRFAVDRVLVDFPYPGTVASQFTATLQPIGLSPDLPAPTGLTATTTRQAYSALSPLAATAMIREVLPSLALSDLLACRIKIAWDTTTGSTYPTLSSEPLTRLTLIVQPKEPM